MSPCSAVHLEGDGCRNQQSTQRNDPWRPRSQTPRCWRAAHRGQCLARALASQPGHRVETRQPPGCGHSASRTLRDSEQRLISRFAKEATRKGLSLPGVNRQMAAKKALWPGCRKAPLRISVYAQRTCRATHPLNSYKCTFRVVGAAAGVILEHF